MCCRMQTLWRMSIALIVIGAALSCFGQPTRTGDVKILAASDAGCTIAFSPAELNWDTLNIAGQTYLKPVFRMAGFGAQPGEPLLPERTVVVALPPGGSARVALVSSQVREMRNGRLLPAPKLAWQDGMPLETYREGPIYRENGSGHSNLVRTDLPGQFGAQRVIRIHIAPVQFDPSRNKITVHTDLVIRVTFVGGGQDITPGRSAPENPILRKTIINTDQARDWRTLQPRVVGKRQPALPGDVYKIPVTEEGIYQVTGRFLSDHGVDIASIDVETLKIYNNGGRELPRDLSIQRPDSLIENPVLVFGITDGRFDPDDYLLFYGRGTAGWDFSETVDDMAHHLHRYASANMYWLAFNDGKAGLRIPDASPVIGVTPLSRTWSRLFVEQELVNPLSGGMHWYGVTLDNQNPSETFTVPLDDPAPGDSVRFRYRFKGASSGSHTLTVRWNGIPVHTVTFSGSAEAERIGLAVGTTRAGENTLTFSYAGSGIAPRVYLDWFEVAYKRTLQASNGKLRVETHQNSGPFVAEMGGFGSEPLVLDITNPAEIVRMPVQTVSGGWTFTGEGSFDQPGIFWAVDPSAYLTPLDIRADNPSDLRNPSNSGDILIIAPESFLEEARRLAAHRESSDGLSVFVADIQDVWDEFGWGILDPTAIRDFVRTAWETWTVRPSYLLLFGDGHYDYRKLLYPAANLVPPFEYDGLTDTGARASDDWYVYVAGNDVMMDLSVGRLPVTTRDEAAAVVDKIINYETNLPFGNWRTLMTMVGDDEKGQRGDENEVTHIRATEYASENTIPPLYNFRKIYLTEYPEIITVEGRRKPAAGDALVNQINQGTLIVNYIGHGRNDLWAHERVFEIGRDLTRLDNVQAPAFIYAATCAFGWYDNPEEQSFAEELVNRSESGAIGVIAACRLCGAAANEALNHAFYEHLLTSEGEPVRLGDALRAAKLTVSATPNNEMYHLLGDPAMHLALPRVSARLTQVAPDTFRALDRIQVRGQVEDNNGVRTDFRGKIALTAYDAKKDVTYTTQYGTVLEYRLPGNALFRGESLVTAGQFEASFIVPKDISYGGLTGRLSCYVWDGQTDGAGFSDDIPVGGSKVLSDATGPDIVLRFSGRDDFTTGGMVTENPELAAEIADDKSGVNITGEIGHKLMLTLNGSDNRDLTDYFRYDEGSFLKGRLTYPLSGLDEGDHNLELKAWDNANNSSTQVIDFRIAKSDALRIEEVLNYPNPFSTSTHFTFQMNQDAEIEIKVFTVDGRLIHHITQILGSAGFNMVSWDGLDSVGDPLSNGVYLYKVIGRTSAGGRDIKAEVIGRMMVMH